MGLTITGRDVYVDGQKLPPVPHSRNRMNVTTAGTRIYINGYVYKRGKWKRTLAALWHDIF